MKKNVLLMVFALVLVFALGTATAFAGELEDGNYYIKQGSKSINVYTDHLSEAKNNTKINMYATDDSDTQKFKLEKQEDGSYKILLAERKTLTLNVKALEAGTTVIAYKDAKVYTEYYLIEETEKAGYYTIRMKNKSSLALTAGEGKELTLKKFTGAENQQFYFHAEGTVCPDLTAAEPTTEPSTETPAEPETPKTETVTEKKTYDIQLDVPKLSTQDKRWKNYYYSKKARIGKYGCLLVSCTAALSEVDEKTYRPDKLASKFKFSSGGSMQWDSKWGKSRFKTGVKYKLSTIRKELEKGNPVLIHGYSEENGHHWAVITGVKGDGTKRKHFTVMDPSFSKVKTLDQFLKKFPDKKKLVTIKE